MPCAGILNQAGSDQFPKAPIACDVRYKEGRLAPNGVPFVPVPVDLVIVVISIEDAGCRSSIVLPFAGKVRHRETLQDAAGNGIDPALGDDVALERPSGQWIVDRRSGLTEVARTNYRRRHIEYAGAAGALPS